MGTTSSSKNSRRNRSWSIDSRTHSLALFLLEPDICWLRLWLQEKRLSSFNPKGNKAKSLFNSALTAQGALIHHSISFILYKMSSSQQTTEYFRSIPCNICCLTCSNRDLIHFYWHLSATRPVCFAILQSAYILFYMAIVGHALSIASLLISLAIFFYFRWQIWPGFGFCTFWHRRPLKGRIKIYDVCPFIIKSDFQLNRCYINTGDLIKKTKKQLLSQISQPECEHHTPEVWLISCQLDIL